MKAQAIQIPALRPHHERLSHKVWKKRYAYIFLLPGLVFFAVFSYVPMAGLILSFEKYNARLGMFLSPFIGWDNFKRIFITPLAVQSIVNTLTISLGRILFEFPAPILQYDGYDHPGKEMGECKGCLVQAL
jgi:putative aldouronate transport system permease protein